MSRRITIETKMGREELVEQSLNDLEANFRKEGAWFRVKGAEGQNFMYTGAGVNTDTQEVHFDEDDRNAKNFVQNRLFQVYNKNLALDTMMLEGHQVDETFEASAGTYIEGFGDVIDEGDIVIRSRASF